VTVTSCFSDRYVLHEININIYRVFYVRNGVGRIVHITVHDAFETSFSMGTWLLYELVVGTTDCTCVILG
jgi:hypothetical protein